MCEFLGRQFRRKNATTHKRVGLLYSVHEFTPGRLPWLSKYRYVIANVTYILSRSRMTTVICRPELYNVLYTWHCRQAYNIQHNLQSPEAESVRQGVPFSRLKLQQYSLVLPIRRPKGSHAIKYKIADIATETISKQQLSSFEDNSRDISIFSLNWLLYPVLSLMNF